jgi:hypothetical protein
MRNLGIDVKVIKWMLMKLRLRSGLISYDSEHEPVTGSCEHDNEPSGSLKGVEVLD